MPLGAGGALSMFNVSRLAKRRSWACYASSCTLTQVKEVNGRDCKDVLERAA